jgi:glycosyltransferase involved in cell wall biosynthesis
MGTSVAVYEPIKLLKSLGHTIDFFTTNYYEDFTDFDKYNAEGIINTIVIADWGPREKIIKKLLNKAKQTLMLFKKNNVYYYPFTKIPACVLKTFHNVINNGGYDFIYIHHYYWHELIIKTIVPPNTKIVAHIQDMLFIHMNFHIKNIKIENLGYVFATEIKNLQRFQSVFFISFDEYLLSRHFISDASFYYFPYITTVSSRLSIKKDIDLLYLGHDNPFNVQGIKWFLDFVFPYLNSNISITFCGKMLSGLSADYCSKIIQSGITTIEFAEDIDALYARVKVIMVPILGGTGMKIKTVEAMAHGIPVVSTLFGVDGFPDKFENGTLVSDNPIEFASYINNLLSNDELYYNTIEKQNAYYKKYFSYSYVKNIFEKVFSP